MTTTELHQSRKEAVAVGSFTSRRVERILQVASGAGSLMVGVQAFIAAVGSSDAGAWHVPLVVAIFASLAAMLISCFTSKGLTITASLFAVMYPVALIIWPFVTRGATDPGAPQPWIWYVTNVATLAAVLVFPLALQVIWTLVLPVLFFFVRMTQVRWDTDYLAGNLFDLSFALCLGAILLLLIRTLRATGRVVDDARGAALQEYARAAETEATEAERIEMAALMHDSVMAALIAAARADSEREQSLSVGMARDALTGLADAESDERMALGRPVSAVVVAQDLVRAAKDYGVEIRIAEPADTEIPGHVARAMTLAATQAIANSVQHAHAVGLGVIVTAGETFCNVDVRDEGHGIDMSSIPHDRLGIRASIFARMAAVGGTANITSRPGSTVVRLGWHR